MAASLSVRLWEMADVVKLLDDATPEARPPVVFIARQIQAKALPGRPPPLTRWPVRDRNNSK